MCVFVRGGEEREREKVRKREIGNASYWEIINNAIDDVLHVSNLLDEPYLAQHLL